MVPEGTVPHERASEADAALHARERGENSPPTPSPFRTRISLFPLRTRTADAAVTAQAPRRRRRRHPYGVIQQVWHGVRCPHQPGHRAVRCHPAECRSPGVRGGGLAGWFRLPAVEGRRAAVSRVRRTAARSPTQGVAHGSDDTGAGTGAGRCPADPCRSRRPVPGGCDGHASGPVPPDAGAPGRRGPGQPSADRAPRTRNASAQPARQHGRHGGARLPQRPAYGHAAADDRLVAPDRAAARSGR